MTVYKGDITITVTSNGEKQPSETFENEHIFFTSKTDSSTILWAGNKANHESEFIQAFMRLYEVDQKNNFKTHFIIELNPKSHGNVYEDKIYRIKSINRENESITFESI